MTAPCPRVLSDRHAQLPDDTLRVARELDHVADVALTAPGADTTRNLQTRRAELHARLQDLTHEAAVIHHARQGFTLIELLVVIAILGVLAALLLPTFSDAQKKPHDTAALLCGRAIITAQTTYKITRQGYASSPAALGPDVTEACSGIEIQSYDPAFTPSAATAGNGQILADADQYLFYVYSRKGKTMYFTGAGVRNTPHTTF